MCLFVFCSLCCGSVRLLCPRGREQMIILKRIITHWINWTKKNVCLYVQTFCNVYPLTAKSEKKKKKDVEKEQVG